MTNVVRWEYQPGSTVFVVWQQGREDFLPFGTLRVGPDLGGAFAAPASNTFLVKINRWFEVPIASTLRRMFAVVSMRDTVRSVRSEAETSGC